MTDIQGTYTMFTEDLCKSWVYYSIEGDSEFWHMIQKLPTFEDLWREYYYVAVELVK